MKNERESKINVQLYPTKKRLVPNFKLCKIIAHLSKEQYEHMVVDGKQRKILEKHNHRRYGEVVTVYKISNADGYDNTDPLNEFDYAENSQWAGLLCHIFRPRKLADDNSSRQKTSLEVRCFLARRSGRAKQLDKRRMSECKAHSKQMASTITFSDTFKKCRIENVDNKIKQRAREVMVKFFEHLQAKG